ncbi:MAG: hypothetical protein ACYDHD_01955 [Vulcanimicrobiaceae bacterium]
MFFRAMIFAITMLTASHVPHAKPTDSCRTYFGNACSEAIGHWLPVFGFGFGPWRRGQATRVPFTDDFVYEGHTPTLGTGEPQDGTFFVYGNAGPPRGRVVYDYQHRIAFYHQGCCSWGSAVASYDNTAPPKNVVRRNLLSLHTSRGIALGDSPERVFRRYAKTKFNAVAGHPNLRRLSYFHQFNHYCGEYDNFVFRGNRLIYIQLLEGC